MTDRKQELVQHSALLRLRLHEEAQGVRASLHWSRVAVAAVGIGRVAQLVTIAGRVLLYVRVARSVFGMARGAITGRGR